MIKYIFSPEIVEREYFSLGSLHKPINRLPCFWCSAVMWLDLVEGLWSVNLQCCRELHLYSLVEVKPSFWLLPSSCQYAWFLLAGFQKKSFCADLGEGHTIQGEGRTQWWALLGSHTWHPGFMYIMITNNLSLIKYWTLPVSTSFYKGRRMHTGNPT